MGGHGMRIEDIVGEDEGGMERGWREEERLRVREGKARGEDEKEGEGEGGRRGSR